MKSISVQKVTKPIPMKRELKVGPKKVGRENTSKSHKANPDEKGTEREIINGMKTAGTKSQSQSR